MNETQRFLNLNNALVDANRRVGRLEQKVATLEEFVAIQTTLIESLTEFTATLANQMETVVAILNVSG